MILSKLHLERQNSGNVDAEAYNIAFSIGDINTVCDHLKSGKLMGPDLIPNEVLRHGGIRAVILSFMNKCFEHHLVPGIWQKAIISPIPKSASKDPCVPLNYSLSLLSCFYKIYSCLLNNRLTNYCEQNNLIVEEQNGFRPGRSCLDYIYSLTSIIRNRISDKSSTYVAFVDMKKAFDWVNRDLMLYKLLAYFIIKGKLYDAIKSISCLLYV